MIMKKIILIGLFVILTIVSVSGCNKQNIEKREIPTFYDGQSWLSAGSGHTNFKCWDNPELAEKNKDVTNTDFESCIYWVDECVNNDCGNYLFSNNCYNRECHQSLVLEKQKLNQEYKIALCPDTNSLKNVMFIGLNDNAEDIRYFSNPIKCFNSDAGWFDMDKRSNNDCYITYLTGVELWKNCSIGYLNTKILPQNS